MAEKLFWQKAALTIFSLTLGFFVVENLLPAQVAMARNISRENLMAVRAAKVDALRNLLEKVYGLQIDSQTTVRNFVLASDVLKTRMSAAIRGAEEIDYQLLDDGTAEVTVEVTLGVLEDILGQLIVYDGDTIEATGYGASPGSAGDGTDYTSTGQHIYAIGYGLPPDEPGLTSAEKSLLALRAAKNDALRNMAEKAYGVRINSESVVRDFVMQKDDIRSRVSAYVQGARVVSEKKLHDGRYQVELEIDVQPLMEIPAR